MKRFYTTATVAQTPAGYEVHLDGKPVNTPERNRVVVPFAKLAKIMAAEWNMQGDMIDPNSMPMTQMMMTIIDRIEPNRANLEREILGYIDTDLICYRTSEPPSAAQAQCQLWDPIITWYEQNMGFTLKTTQGLAGLKQPASAHERFADIARKMDDIDFATLYLVTTESGSILLAMALFLGAIIPAEIYAASFVDEDVKYEIYKGDVYGEAPDLEKRRARFLGELDTLMRLRDLKTSSQI